MQASSIDIEESFNRLRQLLLLNKERAFVKELIDLISESEVDFHPGGAAATRHLISIYSTRKRVQSEVNKDEFVEGYDEVLFNLKNGRETSILVMSLLTANGSYIIFASTNLNTLVGILRSGRTFTEVRHKYADYQVLMAQQGLNYVRQENIFFKGERKI